MAPYDASSTPSSPIPPHRKTRGRPLWLYLAGGCGCLGLLAVLTVVLLSVSSLFMINNAHNLLLGSEEEQARARDIAEQFLDATAAGDGDKALTFWYPKPTSIEEVREFMDTGMNILSATKGRKRVFLKMEGGMMPRIGNKDKHDFNVGIFFEFPGNSPEEDNLCQVKLLDRRIYDKSLNSGESFAVYAAGCADRAKFEEYFGTSLNRQ